MTALKFSLTGFGAPVDISGTEDTEITVVTGSGVIRLPRLALFIEPSSFDAPKKDGSRGKIGLTVTLSDDSQQPTVNNTRINSTVVRANATGFMDPLLDMQERIEALARKFPNVNVIRANSTLVRINVPALSEGFRNIQQQLTALLGG